MFQNSNLNLKKTIETTFARAKGCVFAKYPSKLNPKINIEIDVRYPGEAIPSSYCEVFSSPRCYRINFNSKPVFITLKRGENEVSLKRNVFKTHSGHEEVSYILAIHSHLGLDYRIIEMPDGCTKDQGNALLLKAAQKDQDFGQYISFIPGNCQDVIPSNSFPWPLKEIMTKSREK